jgi:ABC-type spermidine/putrescine transport system permease subunit I
VLRQQVGRLSPLEHLLLTWLAVLREWTTLDTLMLNLLAASFAWIVMLQRHGGVNWFLITLHFSPGPVDFLFTARATLTGMLYVVLPLMILPIFSSLVGIDASYVEAARSLGANQLTAFARITFPLSLPSVAVGMLLVFIASFGLYLVPELLGGPSLTLFPFPIEEQTLVFLNWPLAAALSIMLILVLIPILILLQRPFWKLAEAVPHE